MIGHAQAISGSKMAKVELSIDEKNIDALALMANVLIVQAQNYSEGGDHQSSLSTADALLTKALALQPWHKLARYDQCLLRRAQTRYKEAIAVCRSLADDLYRRPLVYKEIGMDYVYLGDLDQAISAFAA